MLPQGPAGVQARAPDGSARGLGLHAQEHGRQGHDAQAESLGYAILLHAVQFVPVTLIGWGFLLREHLSLADATHATPVEDEPAPSRPTPVGR